MNKQIHAYKRDIDTTNRDGAFLCPQCGAKISPDDHSELVYSIVDICVNSFGLEELLICCNRCSCIIHLSGFSKINELSVMHHSAETEPETDDVPYFVHT